MPSLTPMSGITSEWFPQLRIKVHVDLAGLSPPSDLWNPTGTSSERERTLPSLNNNLLIALVILITTDAKEVFLLTPSNILNMLEVSNLMLPIPTPLRMDNVFSEDKSLLDT